MRDCQLALGPREAPRPFAMRVKNSFREEDLDFLQFLELRVDLMLSKPNYDPLTSKLFSFMGANVAFCGANVCF